VFISTLEKTSSFSWLYLKTTKQKSMMQSLSKWSKSSATHQIMPSPKKSTNQLQQTNQWLVATNELPTTGRAATTAP
jgi:hypothetical protein